jgi:hypothetical protein
MGKPTNLTLKLDSDLVRALKVFAAERGTSISALLTHQAERLVEKKEEYEKARKRAMELMKHSSGSGWNKPKSRDELHER